MLNLLLSRIKQKHRTFDYPNGATPPIPTLFAGKPEVERQCPSDCGHLCVEVCPTNALSYGDEGLKLDLGLCLFCRKCADACHEKKIRFTDNHQLCASTREKLTIPPQNKSQEKSPINKCSIKGAKRSFALRVVSAGGCGACEADTNVLTTIGWDLSRFGIHFVASPRHADGILVMGPLPANMIEATMKTYHAIPNPKVVIAVGTCAVSGGLFKGMETRSNGLDEHLPVDLYIPGCPPHPLTILDGLLRFLGHLE